MMGGMGRGGWVGVVKGEPGKIALQTFNSKMCLAIKVLRTNCRGKEERFGRVTRLQT